jgi:hypothetical protein
MIQMDKLKEYRGNRTTIAFTTIVEFAKPALVPEAVRRAVSHPQQQSDGTFIFSPSTAAKSSDMGTDSGAIRGDHTRRGQRKLLQPTPACSSEPTQTVR